MTSFSSSKDSFATAGKEDQDKRKPKQQPGEPSTASTNKAAPNNSSTPKTTIGGSFDVVKYEYFTKFPSGRFLLLKTCSDNYECGLDALTQSIQAQYADADDTFPTTSVKELRAIAALPELKIPHKRNFVDDDLERILQHWGRMQNRKFCLGVVVQSSNDVYDVGSPFLTSLNQYEGSDTLIVWLHNDNHQLRYPDKDLLNHWSGMGPPRQTRSSSLASTAPVGARTLKITALTRLIALIEVPGPTTVVQFPAKPSGETTADKRPTSATLKTQQPPASKPTRKSKSHLKPSVKKEEQQATLPTLAQPHEFRYLCLVRTCTSSANSLTDLNRHQADKHKEENKFEESSVLRVPWLDWLAGNSQASVPPATYKKYSHLIPKADTDETAPENEKTQASSKKRKATEDLTPEASKKPRNGTNAVPEPDRTDEHTQKQSETSTIGLTPHTPEVLVEIGSSQGVKRKQAASVEDPPAPKPLKKVKITLRVSDKSEAAEREHRDKQGARSTVKERPRTRSVSKASDTSPTTDRSSNSETRPKTRLSTIVEEPEEEQTPIPVATKPATTTPEKDPVNPLEEPASAVNEGPQEVVERITAVPGTKRDLLARHESGNGKGPSPASKTAAGPEPDSSDSEPEGDDDSNASNAKESYKNAVNELDENDLKEKNKAMAKWRKARDAAKNPGEENHALLARDPKADNAYVQDDLDAIFGKPASLPAPQPLLGWEQAKTSPKAQPIEVDQMPPMLVTDEAAQRILERLQKDQITRQEIANLTSIEQAGRTTPGGAAPPKAAANIDTYPDPLAPYWDGKTKTEQELRKNLRSLIPFTEFQRKAEAAVKMGYIKQTASKKKSFIKKGKELTTGTSEVAKEEQLYADLLAATMYIASLRSTFDQTMRDHNRDLQEKEDEIAKLSEGAARSDLLQDKNDKIERMKRRRQAYDLTAAEERRELDERQLSLNEGKLALEEEKRAFDEEKRAFETEKQKMQEEQQKLDEVKKLEQQKKNAPKDKRKNSAETKERSPKGVENSVGDEEDLVNEEEQLPVAKKAPARRKNSAVAGKKTTTVHGKKATQETSVAEEDDPEDTAEGPRKAEPTKEKAKSSAKETTKEKKPAPKKIEKPKKAPSKKQGGKKDTKSKKGPSKGK